MKAEDELQQCQVEFSNQVEVTQESMTELSHIQVDHLKHLTAFVQAQVVLRGEFEKKKLSLIPGGILRQWSQSDAGTVQRSLGVNTKHIQKLE